MNYMRYGGYRGGPNIPDQLAVILGVWLAAKISVNKPKPPTRPPFQPSS